MERILDARYALERRIGEGGMSEVFLARDTQDNGRAVVVKRCRAHLAYEPEFATTFLREARLAALIEHENVVKLFATGDDDGLPYLVMEYLEGFTLRDVFLRAPKIGGISQDVAAAIIMRSARGLHATHRAVDENKRPMHLVHRDVSPHNLFVTADGIVKVLDFGIAKGAHDVTTTRAGHVKGKASYLAPEQLVPPTLVDPRTDIFSLGIVAWETLTSRRLFKRPTEVATIQAIRTLEIPHPKTFTPDVDEGYARVVMRMLAARPDSRPFSMDVVASELELVLRRRLAGRKPEALLAELVAKVRSVAPPEELRAAKGVKAAPKTREEKRKAFEAAWGGGAKEPGKSGARDEATATVAPPVSGAWADQLRDSRSSFPGLFGQAVPRPDKRDSRPPANLAPKQPSSSTMQTAPSINVLNRPPDEGAGGESPRDGSVVGTLAVAGVGQDDWEELESEALELALSGESPALTAQPSALGVSGADREDLELQEDEADPTEVGHQADLKAAMAAAAQAGDDDAPTLVGSRKELQEALATGLKPQTAPSEANAELNLRAKPPSRDLAELLTQPVEGDANAETSGPGVASNPKASRAAPPPPPLESTEILPSRRRIPNETLIVLLSALLIGLIVSYLLTSLLA